MFIASLGIGAVLAVSAVLDRPAGADEVSYAPTHGAVTSVTPPAFVWLPVDDADRYVLEYGTDPDFAASATHRAVSAISVFIPRETLPPGTWYWRYGVESDDGVTYSRTRQFEIPPDAAPFPRPELEVVTARIPESRPRVYFDPDTVADVRAHAGGKYADLVGPVVRNAERHIGEALYPEPEFLPTERQARSTAAVRIFRTMRPFTAGMETCALAYIYTGDERFAEEAKRRLLHFATWDLDGSSNVFHNTEPAMDIAQRGPRTFDWIHDTLTDEERQTCVAFLTRRLADIHELHRRRPFESKPFSSHPGRMVPFVVEGSFVFLHETPDAPRWLDYSLDLLWSVYPAWGSDDGGWHEGLSYWSSYGNRMVWLVCELDRLGVPWKDKPFLRNTGYFGLYCAYPNRQTTSFGDGYESPVGGGHANLLYAHSTLYQNPYFRWYAEQRGGGPSGPIAFNIYDPELEAKPPADLPQARAFKSVGWVAMHSAMANPDNNFFLLFKSSPYGSISHNHANQNAFVIEAFGEALAISSGYYQRYGSPHHAEWTWQTKAHNAVLINGEGQTPRSADSKGFITAFENTDDYAFTTGDATAAYGGRAERALRHVLFHRKGGYILVVDDIQTAEPATVQWLLHAKSAMALDEPAQRVTVSQGKARMSVQFLHPTAMQLTQTTGFDPLPDNEASPAQFHLQAHTREAQTHHQIISMLTPYKAGEDPDVTSAAVTWTVDGFTLTAGESEVLWAAGQNGAATIQLDGHN